MTREIEKLPKFNEKLYDKVVAHILEEPKRMDMDRWVQNPFYVKENRMPACGTVACFGGWSVALSKRWKYAKLNEHYWSIGPMARAALGITWEESDVLFITSRWPQEYREGLNALTPGTKPYAKLVAKFAKKFKAEIKRNRKKDKE